MIQRRTLIGAIGAVALFQCLLLPDDSLCGHASG